jgi:hypothetical protein
LKVDIEQSGRRVFVVCGAVFVVHRVFVVLCLWGSANTRQSGRRVFVCGAPCVCGAVFVVQCKHSSSVCGALFVVQCISL